MSTQPPYPPPPGTPPYGPPAGTDPRDWARQQKDYWRAQKDQNRAYWRANRDQWKAQQQQWRAYYGGGPRRRSVLGPIALIAVGCVAALVYSGAIEPYRFWGWYAHFWPLLLIGLGVLLLAEWLLDRNNPYPRSHGGLGWVIVLLVITGAGSTAHDHFHNGDWGINTDDDSMSFMRGPEHDFDGTMTATLPAGNSVQINSGIHGDISVQPGTGDQIEIALHKRIYRASESEAQKKADNFKPVLSSLSGQTVIALNGDDSEEGNLSVTLPAGAAVHIRNSRGDITVAGQRAAVYVESNHGAIRVRDIEGPVTMRSEGGDLDLDNVKGSVEMRGSWDDVNLANVTGVCTMDGEYNGDIRLRSIGQTHFHSSRTDLSAGRIDGQMTMDGEDLHMSTVAGPLKLATHGKEIELVNVSGDVDVSNADGAVDLTEAKPAGGVQIQNKSGSIRLTLPTGTGFKLRAEARNGDIENDFGIGNSSVGEDHNLTQGNFGSGALNVSLNTEHGDISVHRAETAPTIPDAAPAPPAPPPAPAAPAVAEAPKLTRAPKAPRAPKALSAPAAPAAPAVVSQ